MKNLLSMLFPMDSPCFAFRCGSCLCSLVVVHFFFSVKYFSTFSTHVLPRSGAGSAFTFNDLTHFFTSAFKIKQKMLKLMCADNSVTHYFRPACTIIVAVAKLFISICGCYNAVTQSADFEFLLGALCFS